MDDSRSRDLYDRALSVLPGGVNSSVRATIPYPAFAERGEGGHLIDADGNRYIDYVMAYGPLLLGHDMPESVRAAVQSYASEGPLYGAPTEVEVELAEFVTRHVPSVEMVRFVNSGTEATVSAVRLARGYTGRDTIIMMEGGYHGAQESTAVSFTTTGIPDAFAEHTVTVPFNDEEAMHEAFEEHGDDVACVLTEPILGNNGIVAPEEGYHAATRDLCDEHGALLVFDEVITGFRVGGLGCAQGRFGIEPDLSTFGKVIGGGFPVGALGGRAEIMEHLTPFGDVFQAGTFSGHPVIMAAGLETLRYAAENDVHEHVNDLGERLRSGLEDIVADQAPSYTVAGTDSMFKVLFTRDGGPVRNAGDVADAETARWERIFRPKMKERGVFLPANQYESQFVSYGHDAEDIEATLDAYAEAL